VDLIPQYAKSKLGVGVQVVRRKIKIYYRQPGRGAINKFHRME